MNKLFMTALATVILAGAGTQCFARLGETEEELEKRYGKPLEVRARPPEAPPAEKAMVFTKDNMIVIVHVFQGRSVSEWYWFRDSNRKEFPVEKDPQKAEALLRANSAGVVWEKHPPIASNKEISLYWKRSDEQALAYVLKEEPEILRVQDASFVKESANSDKQKEAGLSGF
jgi:hypothetical protein